ncbi:MAG: ribonuclease HI family protein [Candidatus Heimdallarchaeota archaeon]|nr:ribonuclease HI family protein [Candidatus Heimdallarchaeota archaeon]
MVNKLIIYFDGASKGNPGLAGAGAYIEAEPFQEKYQFKLTKYLGRKTNNQAEYQGLILGLEKTLELLNDGLEINELLIKGDSQLVIEQILGNWRVKSQNLIDLYEKCIFLLNKITNFGVHYKAVHLRRNLNSKADELANEAILNRV